MGSPGRGVIIVEGSSRRRCHRQKDAHLESHLVIAAQPRYPRAQCFRSAIHTADVAYHTVFDHRDLSEVTVHIHADISDHHSHLQPVSRIRGKGGQSTPTDSRSQRSRTSRKGGHVLTRARGPSNKNGLPIPIPHRCPSSGRSHRTTGKTHPGQPAELREAPIKFHVRYECHRAPQCPVPAGDPGTRALPDGPIGAQVSVSRDPSTWTRQGKAEHEGQ